MVQDPTYDRTRRTKTPEQALQTLMDRCAKAEISVSDARRSLYRWGVEPDDQRRVIDALLKQRFIDENRFAAAYVREKARLNRWGVYKIRTGLRTKQIPEEIIAEALTQLDEMDMGSKLEEILKRKMRTLKAKNGYELRGKLLRHGTAQGYDYSEVSELVERLVENVGEEDE